MGNDKIKTLAGLSVDKVADQIDFPLQNWPGNCYAVAVALVESGLLPSGTRAVYGHWRGPISDSSPFASRIGLGFTGHGWALTPEDQIVDPTRWVFEDAAPYIYIGAQADERIDEVCRTCEHLADEHEDLFGGRCAGGDHAGYDCGECYFEPKVSAKATAEDRDYDEGGNQLALERMRPFPTDGGDPVTCTEPPAEVLALLSMHGHTGGLLTSAQAHWAANLPPALLGLAAAPLYSWLTSASLGGLIPIDNKLMVLGGSPTTV